LEPSSNGTCVCFPRAGGHHGARKPAVQIDIGVSALLAHGLQQFLRRQRAQGIERIDTQLSGKRLALLLHLRQRQRRDRGDQRTALADGPCEQAARERRGHQRTHRDRTGRFAGDRHLCRIPTEAGDIGAYPAQRRHLIEQAIVACSMLRRFVGQRRQREEAEHAETVVHGDRDDALAGQAGAVIALLRAVAGHEAAAVEVHQHRQLAADVRGLPDVEIETVLTHAVGAEHHVAEQRQLHAARPETSHLAHAAPRLDRLRRLPTQGSHRRRGVRDALELLKRDGSCRRGLAFDPAIGQLNPRRR